MSAHTWYLTKIPNMQTWRKTISLIRCLGNWVSTCRHMKLYSYLLHWLQSNKPKTSLWNLKQWKCWNKTLNILNIVNWWRYTESICFLITFSRLFNYNVAKCFNTNWKYVSHIALWYWICLVNKSDIDLNLFNIYLCSKAYFFFMKYGIYCFFMSVFAVKQGFLDDKWLLHLHVGINIKFILD